MHRVWPTRIIYRDTLYRDDLAGLFDDLASSYGALDVVWAPSRVRKPHPPADTFETVCARVGKKTLSALTLELNDADKQARFQIAIGPATIVVSTTEQAWPDKDDLLDRLDGHFKEMPQFAMRWPDFLKGRKPVEFVPVLITGLIIGYVVTLSADPLAVVSLLLLAVSALLTAIFWLDHCSKRPIHLSLDRKDGGFSRARVVNMVLGTVTAVQAILIKTGIDYAAARLHFR